MKATIYLILATALWGLNYHFAKLVLHEVAFIEGAFWRYGLAVAILLVVNIKNLPGLQLYKANFKGVFSIGAIALFGFNIFFFLGMRSTTGFNGALIMGLNPAVTLLLSTLILGTMIKWNHLLGIVIAMLGVLFLLLKGQLHKIGELSFSSGDLLVLISSFFFALHHVWVKKYSSHTVSNQQFTLMNAVMCFTCFLFVVPFTEMSNVMQHSSSFWIGALGIGCLGTGIAYLFWTNGVKEIGANKAGVFVNLVPLSAGLSASFFGETIYYYHFISAVIIITGLVVMQTKIFQPKED